MMKLITLSQFVLKKDEQIRKGKIDVYDFTMSVTDYALFLQRPLELGMFVPCDDNGDILIEPSDSYDNLQYYGAEMDDYMLAIDRILFKGFYYEKTNTSGVRMLGYKDRKCCIGFRHAFHALGKEICQNIEALINYEFYRPYEGIELTGTALEESRLITLI